MHNNSTNAAQTLISPLQIGNVTLPNALALAPMAGVTDLPYRLLCHEMGAGLVCMEMVSAKAIYYNNKKTEDLMEIHPGERPVSLQLFGSDPDIISDMAKKIEDRPFDVLDFNMGCPVPKVVGNGEGSALMKDPALAKEILSKLAKAIQKPVTVKIRKGFDEDHVKQVVPDDIEYDIDNDYDIDQNEKDTIINEALQAASNPQPSFDKKK